MATTKIWEGEKNGIFTQIFGNSWSEVYNGLKERDMLANQHDYSPYGKALVEKNNLDWRDYKKCLDECLVCDIYDYIKEKDIKLVDLTEDELKSLIYNETIDEWDCELSEEN